MTWSILAPFCALMFQTVRPDHAEAVADLALDMRAEVARIVEDTGVPPTLRMGIDTGPVVAGVIGDLKFTYDLGATRSTSPAGWNPMASRAIISRVSAIDPEMP